MSLAPEAGKLNRIITIESLSQTKDAEGGMVDNWTPFAANIFAGVNNLSGNEKRLTDHGGKTAEARTEFTIRWRAGVLETMRIVYNTRIYNIKHINNYREENRFLIITTDTGVNDGR